MAKILKNPYENYKSQFANLGVFVGQKSIFSRFLIKVVLYHFKGTYLRGTCFKV